jgi:hypothetical protein
MLRMDRRFLDELLLSTHFVNRPLVLVDVGGAGGVPFHWRWIARHSHCVSFEADERDRESIERAARYWRELTLVSGVVTASGEEQIPFYLTRSPHCSSTLEPNAESLSKWEFGRLFEVQEVVSLRSVALDDALTLAGVDYVDWFKTDSQGTDLRLWDSLAERRRMGVTVAQFEPGILNAYRGEDKLHQVLERMGTSEWFLARLEVRGSRRIDEGQISGLGRARRRLARATLERTPGWAEAWFLRDYDEIGGVPSTRSLLAAWIAGSLLGQHGYAWAMAQVGAQQYGDDVFDACAEQSVRALTFPTATTLRSLSNAALARLKSRRA